MKYGLTMKKAEGKFPQQMPEEIKLNLGCGNDIRSGFLNLDLYSDHPEVIYCDVRKLPFMDNSVSLIVANDVLDLFSHRETDLVLKEWHRVLKSDSEIIIRVPNLKSQIEAYIKGDWDADVFSYMIYGSQTNPLDYRAVAFDIKSLSSRLLRSGFRIIDIQELNYSQDRGFLNQKISVKAAKVAINATIDLSNNDSFFQSTLFEQLDKSELIEEANDNISESHLEEAQDDDYDYSYLLKENIKETPPPIDKFIINEDEPIGELNVTVDDYSVFDDYDLDLLSEIVSGDYKDLLNNDKIIENNETDTVVKDYPINIVWEGSQFVYHSLALINREHCFNIIKSDIANLTIIPYEPDTFDYNIDEKYSLLASNDIRFKQDVSNEIASRPYCWIRHQWPPKSEIPKGAKWIIMQPWEFSSLPKDFVTLFNQTDEVWTPSNCSRKAIVDSGVDFDKVQIIPNGINPNVFTPNGEKYKLPTNKRFKFLFVGGTIYRKGIDILLQAYLKSFTNNDNISLIIKDMGSSSFYAGQTNQKLINDIKNIAVAPEIIYIDNELTEQEMASLYRACDVLVAPYRGEGFGLPVLEAMACGLPVVVTDGGSTDDFVDSAFSWRIPAIKKSVGYELDGKPFANEAYLLEPDTDELIKILKDIINNSLNLKSIGMLAQYSARTDWTWNQATLKLLTRLDYLYGTNMSMKAQEKLWSAPDGSLFAGEAEANYIAGDYQVAEELFNKAIKTGGISDEYMLHSLHRLAIMYINNNNGEFYKVVNMAESILPNHQDTNYVKAIKYASQKNNEQAISLITKIIDEWEHNAEQSTLGYTIDDVLVLLGDLIYSNGDLDTAVKIYTNALKINHNNEFACYGAGKCFRDSGLNDFAKDMFEWAVKINPEFEEATLELERA